MPARTHGRACRRPAAAAQPWACSARAAPDTSGSCDNALRSRSRNVSLSKSVMVSRDRSSLGLKVKERRVKTLHRIVAVAAISLFGFAANAQPYPSKPITIVVPFGPGSGTDIITRIIAQRLATAVNQSVIVENKPGANGTIAA